MKNYQYALIGLGAFILNQNSFAINKEPSKDRKPTPLMASHLPKNLRKELHINNTMSYATGHQFYDSKVILMGENGTQIQYKEDLKPSQHYQLIKTEAPQLSHDTIWFFSPNGVEPTDQDAWWQCTAEQPCNTLSQGIIDNIHKTMENHRTDNNSIWVASGTYELPRNARNNSAQVLEMYDRLAIAGRTPDFKHIAFEQERPALKGTLAWNSFNGHGGANGSINNLRIVTGKNTIQVENFTVDASVYASGYIYIGNSDLNKFNGEDSTNVYGFEPYIDRSSLSISGEYATNVTSYGMGVHIRDSQLSSSGTVVTRNLNHIDMDDSYITIRDSQLASKINLCNSEYSHAVAIDLRPSTRLYVEDTEIKVSSTDPCTSKHTLYAISTNFFTSGNEFVIESSHIAVNNTNGGSYGIYGDALLNIAHSKIEIGSTNSEASVFSYNYKEVIFDKGQSILAVSSPTLASIFAYSTAPITNKSTPLSLCKVNGVPNIC